MYNIQQRMIIILYTYVHVKWDVKALYCLFMMYWGMDRSVSLFMHTRIISQRITETSA